MGRNKSNKATEATWIKKSPTQTKQHQNNDRTFDKENRNNLKSSTELQSSKGVTKQEQLQNWEAYHDWRIRRVWAMLSKECIPDTYECRALGVMNLYSARPIKTYTDCMWEWVVISEVKFPKGTCICSREGVRLVMLWNRKTNCNAIVCNVCETRIYGESTKSADLKDSNADLNSCQSCELKLCKANMKYCETCWQCGDRKPRYKPSAIGTCFQ